MLRPIALKITALLLVLVFATTSCSNEASPTPAPAEPSPTAAPAPTAAPTDTGGEADPNPEAEDKFKWEGVEVPKGSGVLEIQISSRITEGFSAIVVTVSNLEVQEADAGEEEGWTSLFEDTASGSGSVDPRTFDLIETGLGEKVLGFEVLPIGKYTQIRMDVDNVEITIQSADGSSTTKIAELTGEKLKLVRKVNIEDQSKAILTVDFDAGKSLVTKYGGDFRFEPVFRLKGRSHSFRCGRHFCN